MDQERGAENARIASVCTGIYGLASAGFPDNRRVTTHGRQLETSRNVFPSCAWMRMRYSSAKAWIHSHQQPDLSVRKLVARIF